MMQAAATPAAPPQRAGKVCYQIMSEHQLRRLLSQIPGMPTTGNKAVLESRHKEYVLRFNAELDRGGNVSIKSIVDAMGKQERSRSRVNGRTPFTAAATNAATVQPLRVEEAPAPSDAPAPGTDAGSLAAGASALAPRGPLRAPPGLRPLPPGARPSDFLSLIDNVRRRRASAGR